MARRPYPTIDGIAVPIFELDLPERHRSEENNHHNEWLRRDMARLAVTHALRNLARHQYILPIDIHQWVHNNFDPPELPNEKQAAKEIICAYERGEQFKIYNRSTQQYDFHDIPLDTVDELVRKHDLHGTLDDRIGRMLEAEDKTQDPTVPYKRRKYRILTAEEPIV